MNSGAYPIPKTLVQQLRTIGPIHEDSADGYCFAIRLVLREDYSPGGFIVEQRLAERTVSAPDGHGLTFNVPARAEQHSEASFTFAESLTAALECLRRNQSAGAAGASAAE